MAGIFEDDKSVVELYGQDKSCNVVPFFKCSS